MDLEIQRLGNLIGIKTPKSFLGFHAENMEVAKLSPEAWQAFTEPNEASESLASWSNETNSDVQREKLSSEVTALSINVTQICNLHCHYCAAGGDGTYGDPVRKISVEKTLPQIDFFLQKAPEGSNFQITFIGGEPLLYPDALKGLGLHAMEKAKNRNIKLKFSVVTNGTLINDKSIDALKTLQANITVSLDGPPEINDRSRPDKSGQGMTQKVADGIKNLIRHRSDLGRIQISAVFGPSNLDVNSAYDYFKSFGVDEFDFMFDHLCSDAEISANFVKKMQNLMERVSSEEGETGLRRFKQLNQWLEQLDSQTQVENFCGAGKSFLMVDSRNTIYTCPWDVGKKDQIVGHGSQLWSDKLVPYQAPQIEKNNCQSCWARFLCGGGCMYIHSQSTGSKHIKDQSFCTRTRSLIASTLVYYEQFRQTEEEGVL